MKARTVFRVAVAAGLIIVAASGAALAQQPSSGAMSLNITPGARADAMGRANVALSNDATSNWWNPAALASLDQRVFSLMHTQLVPGLATDVYYEYLGYAQHVEGWGGVGASLIFLTYGKSIATDELGNEKGVFSSYELAPSISLGTELFRGLSGGITLKYVYVSLVPKDFTPNGKAGTGDTFAADIGGLYDMSKLGIPVRLGVNVQNLGPNISFIDADQSDPIGRNLKLGVAVKPFDSGSFRLLAEGDYNKNLIWFNQRAIVNGGMELAYSTYAALRLGYIDDKDGEITAATYGFGIQVGTLAFDFASVPQATGLDRVKKLSLTYRF